MTQKEFETLTGTEVLAEAYVSIEKMYMNCDLDKQLFAKEYMKCKDNDLFRSYYCQFNTLLDKSTAQKKQLDKLAIFLIEQAHKYSSMECRDKAIEMVGFNEYIAYKLQNDMKLWEVDKIDLINTLKRN